MIGFIGGVLRTIIGKGLGCSIQAPNPSSGVATPSAPSNLAAAVNSSTPSTINLTWTDNSSNETGFKVYESTDNVTFNLINTTAAGATSYNRTLRTKDQIYYYKVCATNASGDSAFTSTVNATPAAVAVTWDTLTNIVINTTTVNKNAGGAAFNAAARATTRSRGTGDYYFEFEVVGNGNGFICGLTSDMTGVSYTDVEFGMNNSNISSPFQIHVYETGSDRGSKGTYVVGDIFAVKCISDVVSYYKNGTLLYTSGVSASGKDLTPMCAAFNTGDQIQNAKYFR